MQNSIIEKAKRLGLDTGSGDSSPDNLRTIASQVGLDDFNLDEDLGRLDSILDEKLQIDDKLNDVNDTDNIEYLSDTPNTPAQREKFGQREYNNAKNSDGVYDKNHYKNRQKDLDQKVFDLDNERRKTHKLKKDANAPVKADGSNTVRKSKMDQVMDNLKYANAKKNALTNKIDDVKAKAYNATHPTEALKDAAKSKAKTAVKNVEQKAAAKVKAVQKKAADKVKKVALSVGKKIVAFILTNPGIIAIIGIAIIIFIVILIIAGFDYNDNGGYFSEACNYNLTTVNLKTCSSEESEEESISMGIKDYVYGSTYALLKETDYNTELLKAVMILVKTNALGMGNYDSQNKNISIDGCSVSYESDIPTEVQSEFDSVYYEIENYLYLPSAYNDMISKLPSSDTINVTRDLIETLNSEESSDYKSILNSIQLDDEETTYQIYDLASHCEYIAITNSSSCEEFSLKSTVLSKSDFVAKINSYYSGKSGSYAKEFINHAEDIYDICVKNNINPEVLVTRADVEGYSPGDYYNYYGIGCTNNGGGKDCIRYSSFNEGVLGFIKTVSKYDTLSDMMNKYAYIGSVWANPGSSGKGGCYYYPYMKQYLSTARSAQVAGFCSESNRCSDANCAPTTDEDQKAYSMYQVNINMIPKRQTIFNITSDECIGGNGIDSNYKGTVYDSGNCVLFNQSDDRWGSYKLGSSNDTVSGSGCTITAITMGIKCSGTQVTVSELNPGTFVKALNSGNCFTGNGRLIWGCSAIKQIAPNLADAISIEMGAYSVSEKINKINNYSPAEYITLLRIQNKSIQEHWVLFQEISGDKVVVKDPSGGKINTYNLTDITRIVAYKFK